MLACREAIGSKSAQTGSIRKKETEMRLIASDFISLDGVAQAPGGAEEDTDGGFAHGGWSMPYFDMEIMASYIDEAMQDTDALLFGRRTWQTMGAHWPDRAGSDPFADRMNAIKKYVVSDTLSDEDLTWQNSTLIAGDDLVEAVTELKAQEGGAIQTMGSTQLVRHLAGHGLIDEYLLMIEPIILGGGKSIFPDDGSAQKLKLDDLRQTSTGVLIAKYLTV
jgi:dihydrofolate reductase